MGSNGPTADVGYDVAFFDKVRREARTELTAIEWSRDGFATRRNEEFRRLAEEPDRHDAGFRFLDAADYSVERFQQEIEAKETPVILRGVVEEDGWWATDTYEETWGLGPVCERFKDVKMKCGESDDGVVLKTPLGKFKEYATCNGDDSPLYVFDSKFTTRDETSTLKHSYRVPKYFDKDLFRYVPRDRPPNKWLLLGPQRSGTTVHIDPNQSSAWNALLSGYKRWVLFPPATSRRLAKGKDYVRKGEDDEAIQYFVNVLPRMRADMLAGNGVVSSGERLQMYEVTQRPGEVIFVPGGWWHAVINLTDAVAVTQNFVTETRFARCWQDIRTGRPCMARRWLAVLEQRRPDLHAWAERLNAQDGFDMVRAQDRRHRARRKRDKAWVEERVRKAQKRKREHSEQAFTAEDEAAARERAAKRLRRRRRRSSSTTSSGSSSSSSSSSCTTSTSSSSTRSSLSQAS